MEANEWTNDAVLKEGGVNEDFLSPLYIFLSRERSRSKREKGGFETRIHVYITSLFFILRLLLIPPPFDVFSSRNEIQSFHKK